MARNLQPDSPMFAAILSAARNAERLDRETALRSGGYSEAHIARTLAAYDATDPRVTPEHVPYVRRSTMAQTAAMAL